MELADLQDRALAIRHRYAALERHRYGREWTDEEITLGFVGDVGDLVKLVQSRNGIRTIPDADAKLAHELADCLWSGFVLADTYNVDLERTFIATMDDLERQIEAQTSDR